MPDTEKDSVIYFIILGFSNRCLISTHPEVGTHSRLVILLSGEVSEQNGQNCQLCETWVLAIRRRHSQ